MLAHARQVLCLNDTAKPSKLTLTCLHFLNTGSRMPGLCGTQIFMYAGNHYTNHATSQLTTEASLRKELYHILAEFSQTPR